ncbi:MAG TPA: cytochrome c-type biogenesis CcmF C-terminal domain-containing protein, partial [Rhabdaerophilum sp.]|nr:cytochrome c-type biogenesis CcmF C-terminal domain-containing protein [Rhabdaerophilum sp.]
SREGALVFNNLFLSVAALAVFIGTLYPLLLEALTGAKISVGAPFFNLTAVPLMIPLFLAIPVGQKLAWKRGDLAGTMSRLWWVLALAIGGAAGVASVVSGGPVLALAGLALGLFLVLGAVDELIDRAARGGWARFVPRLAAIPRASVAMVLAHAGAGLMVLGISATAFEKEKIVSIKAGETIALGQYSLTLNGLTTQTGPNYNALVARFTLRDGTGVVAELNPAKRVYVGRQMPTSEVARHREGLSEVYLAIGETSGGDRVDLRAYYKPYVLLIWLGPLLMSIGGLLSLTDRRLRVGAPRRTRVAIQGNLAE